MIDYIQGETKPIRLHLLGKITKDPIDLTTASFIEVCIPGTTAPVNFYHETMEGDTTNTSDLVSNIADTAHIFEGMRVSGAGIPANTTVLKTPQSTTAPTAAGVVQLSANATATATGVALLFENVIKEAGDNGVVQALPTKALSNAFKAAKEQTIEVTYIINDIVYKAQQTKILNVTKSICA
jgi:hypothetical protein